MVLNDGKKTVGHNFFNGVSQGQFYWLCHSVTFNFLLSLCHLSPPPKKKVSLCNPRYPGVHSVNKDGMKIRDPPACVSWVQELKVCTTTPGWIILFKTEVFLRLDYCFNALFDITIGTSPFWDRLKALSDPLVENL